MAEAREFLLPDLGEGLTDAEIVQWLVKPGDHIELNQPIVEVETEKALVEIPSPFEGVVEEIHGDVGQRVQVGSPLIRVREDGAESAAEADAAARAGEETEQARKRTEVLVGYGPEEGASRRRKQRRIGRRDGGPEADVTEPPPAPEPPAEVEPPAPEPAAPAPGGNGELPQRALATPPVRKLARDLGVDIEHLGGSGPDGRVMREDVLAAVEAREAEKPGVEEAEVVPAGPARVRLAAEVEEERIPVRAIRRSIAERMVKSVYTIPHVTEWLQVDATDLMRLRAELQAAPEAGGQKISPLPITVKALLAALRKFPLVNSTWDEEKTEIVVKHVFHVGIATDTDRGLLVPVVRDAANLNVFELASEIGRVVKSARDGSIERADLTGSTITVTNIGSFGMESGTPIINYPECAILALGTVAKRPWVIGDEVVARDVMTLALSFDHRIVDGAYAGRFLRYLADLIEKPARLFGVL